MKHRTYAREITKEYLKKCGVESVDENGRLIIVKGKEAKQFAMPSGNKEYMYIRLYDHDKRMAIPKEERKSSTGQVNLGVHIINYVWNVADKPQGLVVDHIDNNSINNHISNLQLLTPRENVNKELNKPPRIVKMPKYTSEAEILKKLESYEQKYEQAKADHDQSAAHTLRSRLSEWRAKHRIFLENPEKYTRPEKVKKVVEHECHARADKRRELQANIDSTRKFYQQMLEAYGKDDKITEQAWGEWKLAIAMMYGFKEECKKAKEKIS
jgi:hypothetical protein